MSMNEEVCPICKGSGMYKTTRFNGWIRTGEHLEKTCWMCGGSGKVFTQPTKHQLIHKYWSNGGDYAVGDTQERE